MDDIETGTTRASEHSFARDVCAAARQARDAREVTYLTVNGDRIAAVMPLPAPGSPEPCHYCNMFISRDSEGRYPTSHPAIEDPWHCQASADGAHHPDRSR
jgi:hypothetical protein